MLHLCCLCPLVSLRCFHLQGVLEATDSRTHPEAQQLHRSAVLTEVYQSPRLPLTLVRPGNEAHAPGGTQPASSTNKPAWHTGRIKEDLCSGLTNRSSGSSSQQPGRRPLSPRNALQDTSQPSPSSSAGVQRARGSGLTSYKAGVNPEDAAWEAGLPRGLTVEKCAGLPQSASVQQLMEVRAATSSSICRLSQLAVVVWHMRVLPSVCSN
jgi:hypothetical protein